MPLTIRSLSALEAHILIGDLIDLLQDAVEDGASMGFLPPLLLEKARAYWLSVFEELGQNTLILLVAESQGRVLGSIQLQPATQQNATHRAEVQKLMVHTAARRQGIGRALMKAVEAEALHLGRTLLILDTHPGDPAERLYLKQGYQLAGLIPNYALDAEGVLQSTVIYYRWIDPTDPGRARGSR